MDQPENTKKHPAERLGKSARTSWQ